MRMPRVRFTVRGTMVAATIVGTIIGGKAFLDARESARRAECLSNIHSLAMDLLQSAFAYREFPAGTIARAGAPPEGRSSWVVSIWGYFDFKDGPLVQDDWGNPVPAHTGEVKRLECPCNPKRTTPAGLGLTHFVGIAGLGADAPTLPSNSPRAGVFGYDRTTRLGDITDGAATTMLIAETALENRPWVMGGPATVRGVDPSRRPYLGRSRQFGGTHRGGATVAFVDGSARFVRDSIDSKIFEAMSTIAGGESVPADWDK